MRFFYDGIPPVPEEFKEWIFRTLPDNQEVGRFNIEKRVGAKVFDESLVVGKDRGIANVVVWMRSTDAPIPAAEKLPPLTVALKNGRISPHVAATRSPCELILRNDDSTACALTFNCFAALRRRPNGVQSNASTGRASVERLPSS